MKKNILSLFFVLTLSLSLFSACGLKKVENEYVTMLPGTWEGAKDFSEGLAAVKKDGKWGFIDVDGNIVISLQYEDVHSFSEGLAAVRRNGKWGYVDRSGTAAVPFTLSYTSAFYEDRAVYGEGYYYGYIDKTGKKITDAVYTEADRFRNGAACVKKDDAYGFIRPDGSKITDFIYGMESRFSEGVAAVFPKNIKDGVNTGYIDLSGQTVLPFTWYDGKDFSEGIAAVEKEYPGLWGYMDKNGAEVIEARWDSAEKFCGGIALVEKDRKYTYINTAGEAITQATYDKAYSFTDSGLARVGRQSGTGYQFGFIDKTGKEAIGLKYENARDFHNGYAAVCKSGRWGFLAADGTEITGEKWTDAGDMTPEGIACVRTKDNFGFVKLK